MGAAGIKRLRTPPGSGDVSSALVQLVRVENVERVWWGSCDMNADPEPSYKSRHMYMHSSHTLTCTNMNTKSHTSKYIKDVQHTCTHNHSSVTTPVANSPTQMHAFHECG